MKPDECQRLKKRIGNRTFEKRLARERYRKGETDVPKGRFARFARMMVVHKLRWVGPAVRFCFKASGLYPMAHRNYLRLAVTEREQPLAHLPREFDGFRVLHLSDLHLDLDPSLVDALVPVLRTVKADICVLTGDYRNHTIGEWHEAVSYFAKMMEALPMPVYGVLGNHDSLEQVEPLERTGARMLLNEHVLLQRDGASLCLAGIDDPNVYCTHHVPSALKDVPKDMCKLLLAHSPAAWAVAEKAGIDFYLAGHLHGGQICPPWGGVYLRNDKSPSKFWIGAWSSGAMAGYTSRGTGGCGVPLRLFSPPEIVVHTLRTATDNPPHCGERNLLAKR